MMRQREKKKGQVAHRLEGTGENPAVDSAEEKEITTLVFLSCRLTDCPHETDARARS